ncbi:MAG: T9SS type A sorting domain-containing protein, partial [Calditrichaeota bacterium]|nr:T9SS type A sorting domain-containing protein [Calditrichota bacterium]
AYIVSDADTIPNPPLQFYATGLPGPAAFAELSNGDGQQDTVAQTLPKPLQIKITDEFENPVAGFDVNFRVVSGSGSFSNESETTVPSGEDGVAEIFFTLGKNAGRNQVQAICANLSPDTISFHAIGVPDRPKQLVYKSGNDQTGSPNTQLTEPLAVQVADQFGNGISNFAVTFTVVSDEGRFGNSRSITRSTDSTGVAEAFLTLGDVIGDSNNVVQATGSFENAALENSPITFYASVIKSDPQRLVPISSTTGLLGAPHRELPEPVIVKVLDNNEQPVFEFPVHFKVMQGGGNLLPEGTDSLTVLTDSVGCASARWVLGELGQEQTLRASAAWNEQALENSPLTFQAIAIQTDAHRLTYASGNNQSGGVGEALEKDFVVRVYDDLSAPVQDHPVQFSVITGGGYFQENADSLLLVQTDKDGYAHARLVLGNVVGENTHVVHAVSYDSQGIELADSPVIFTATGKPGAFNADQSLITAISPVPANGAAASVIRVMPRDAFGNALPSRAVTIVATGVNANVNPLTGTTDANGIFTAQATSTTPGELNVRAMDTETSTWFATDASITFFVTDASRARKAGPPDLTVLPNSALKELLVVKITNDADQPVYGFPVTFTVTDSNAVIDTPQPVYSDSAGLARCRVIAASEIGAADVLASSPGLQGDSLVFSLSVQEPSNLILVALNSDTLFGHVTEKLASAVEFALKDGSGRPAGAMKIQINTQDASIAYPDSNLVNTDADGIARTTATLGRKAGTTRFTAELVGSDIRTENFITAVAGDAAQLIIASGNHQEQVVGSILSDSLEVKVTDAFNNGVSNRDVLFSILKGNGTFLSQPQGKTDKQGIARVRFQLGTQSGKNIVNAAVPDTEISPVEFELIGNPGEARAMSIADGNDQQGIAGHKLSQPLQVLVADQFGNGVPGVQVTFTALPGQGTILPQPKVTSDSLGIAAVEWVLGAQSGQQTIYASHAGLNNSPLSFTATAIANTAPQIQLPDSFVVRENETLTFQVQAADAQNDSVFYSAENLPLGAAFNDTSHTFTWKPTYQQAGFYTVIFNASDQTGAKSSKEITIHVLNVNRPPVISLQDSRPLDHNLGTVEKPRFIRFLVVASDPDSDKLNYLWLENGKRSSVAATFFFRSSETPIGAVTVEALVYDREDTTRAVWTLDVIASVELKYFSGEHQAFKGVKLSWETSSENDNLGFYVLRATRKDGPFVQIGNLISSQENGRYQFVDQDITPGVKYYYQLQDVQTDGSRHDHETIMIEPSMPTQLTLYQNYPNPFNPSTEIRFELPKPVHVSLVIFDILGRQVRTLANKKMKPGYYSFKWNGLNAENLQVAAGVYYVLMQTRQKRFVKKMVLLR